jgi:hypothetical protein
VSIIFKKSEGIFVEKLVLCYDINLRVVRSRLRVGESFDIIERKLTLGGKEACFFYIDGFVKDGEMLRLMQFLLSEKKIGSAEELEKTIPYVEVARVDRVGEIVRAVLAGQSALLCESFGGEAVLLDLRTYPARDTAEPESDRVMQGPRDGFVETLVMNTALILIILSPGFIILNGILPVKRCRIMNSSMAYVMTATIELPSPCPTRPSRWVSARSTS